MLCFADVRDKYPTKYDEVKDQFIVQLPNSQLAFTRKGKLYGANMSEWANSGFCFNSTSKSLNCNEKEYQMARLAYDFRANAAFPSYEQAMRLTASGDIRGIPFTTKDMQRSYEIFGDHPARLKGAMENQKFGLAPLEATVFKPNIAHGCAKHRIVRFSNHCRSSA